MDSGKGCAAFWVLRNVDFAFDVSYRVLIIKDYSDDFGRQVKDFEFYLNGLSLSGCDVHV
jgi:3-hydroxy-3-methylglutaryl CoA synthase